MRRLIVHVGHPKTGSSAIQAFLGSHVAALVERGIQYPATRDLIDAAHRQAVTSGNGSLLVTQPDRVRLPDDGDILFSSELIFERLTEKEYRASLKDLASRNNAELSLICFTRDFFEFTFSGWSQYIKRGGGELGYMDFMLAEDVGRYALNGDNFRKLKDVVAACAEESIELKVFNYDRHKPDLVSYFLSCALDFPPGIEVPSRAQRQINRSLTASEVELQRAFNKYFPGQSYAFVSAPLVEGLPTGDSSVPVFSEADYSLICDRHSDLLTELNKSLPASEQVSITPFERLSLLMGDHDPETLTFSRDQIEIVARSLSDVIVSGQHASIRSILRRAVDSRLARLKRRIVR